MELFDAHCHLQDERLAARLPEVLARARQAGVCRFLCCGSEEGDWEAVRRLAAQYPAVVPAFGLHPWYVRNRTDRWLETLERLLSDAPSAVGEIGLDHALDARDDAAQEQVFVAQFELARRMQRPVTIHCRKAWGRMLDLLRDAGGVPRGGVVHSYSGPPELVGELERLGLFISFSGAITRSGNRRGQRAAQAVSSDRLLIETDSPDLLPVGAAGEINEPAHLVLVAAAVARILKTTPETIASQTWKNAVRLVNSVRNFKV